MGEKMKLQRKITLYFIAILLISIGSITVLSYEQMRALMRDQIETNLLNVAEAVANSYEVQDYLTRDTQLTQEELSQQIETIRQLTRVDFIVVIDMEGTRYSHPLKEEIGKKFRGGDEERVLRTGEKYVSEAKGTLGTSLRAFVPIYKDNRQIGAVSVGMLIDVVMSKIYNNIIKFLSFILFGLFLGVLGAALLSSSIKNTIFRMEPEEIALALKEKEVVLNNVKEGIIAVDALGKITLFNQEASRILHLNHENLGQNISEVLGIQTIYDQGLRRGEQLEDVEIKVRPTVTILCKYNPILNDRQHVMGAVVNFRDLSEVKKMAEELTGIKKMTWALRAQNHEFMNKLHTVSALIQLEEYDEAVEYISNTVKTRNSINGILTKQIKDVALAALLFAKYNKAEEARIKLIIDPDSKLTQLPEGITSEDLGSVLGNLIENSIEALKGIPNGSIYVKISEDREKLYIMVKDNGPGIPTEIQTDIYDLGVTSKSSQRGYGMYIVKKIIDDAQGCIQFKVDEGTLWQIKIPLNKSLKV